MVQRELPVRQGLSAGSSAGNPLGAQAPAGPIRTCVGCRKRGLAADLLRVCARHIDTTRYELVPDPRRRLPGRGAWLHPAVECMRTADRRRAFGKALRVPGVLDISALAQYLIEKDRHEHS